MSLTLQQRRQAIRRAQVKIRPYELTPEQEVAIAEFDAAPDNSPLKKAIRKEAAQPAATVGSR